MRRALVIAAALVTITGACELFYPFDVDAGADAEAGGADTGTVDAADASSNDADSGVVVLLTNVDAGSSLAADDASLYWFAGNSDGVTAALMRTDKIDGGATPMLLDAGSNPTGLTVIGGVFFWTIRTAPYQAKGGAVMSMLVDASAPTVLASQNGNGTWGPDAVTRDDAGTLYVLNSAGTSPVVSRLESDGGLTPLTQDKTATPAPESLTLDDQFVYWTHASQVYRVRSGCGKADAGACMPEVVVQDTYTAQYGIRDVAVDDASVFWDIYSNLSSYPEPAVYRTPKGLTAPDAAIVLIGGGVSDRFIGLALGGNDVYSVWDNAITRVGKDGTDVTTIAKGDVRPPLVVDDASIYWIDGTQNEIKKAPR